MARGGHAENMRRATTAKHVTKKRLRLLAWLAENPRGTIRAASVAVGVSHARVWYQIRALQSLGLLAIDSQFEDYIVTDKGREALGGRPEVCARGPSSRCETA